MTLRYLAIGASAIGLALGSYPVDAQAARVASAEGTAIAGPVVSGVRAFWPEAVAARLFLRSLNGAGQLTTVWSQRGAPGAQPGVVPEFSVPSISAGRGRLAFVRDVWPPSGGDLFIPPLSATLFAGRPGRIRALRSTEEACSPHLAPAEVAVSSAGLVTYEESSLLCPLIRPRAALLLRSFGGRRLRTLRTFPTTGQLYSLSAAGRWVAWLEITTGRPVLHVFDLRTGSLALRRRVPRAIRTVAVDAQGNFAIATGAGLSSCQSQPTFAIRSTFLRRPHLRTIIRRAAGAYFAIFDGSVAFTTATAARPPGFGATVFSSNGSLLRFPGLQDFTELWDIAYDGKALAVADAERVGLMISNRSAIGDQK